MVDALERAHEGIAVQVVTIRTSGDEALSGSVSPHPPDDKSRFTREIEEALVAGKIDLAVHSAKDVPGNLPAGLAIVGVPERADARDRLCGAASLASLPEGARVGTSSLRRRSQLLARRPDLEVSDLRGNVDTRLRRLAEGRHDAIVLAVAGLVRLGRDDGSTLSESDMTPAPGQGCLALEGRADDEEVRELATALTDWGSLVRLTAERAVVTALGASCRTPVGAHAQLVDGALRLDAFVGLPDGSTWIRDSVEGDPNDPAGIGRTAAERLLAAGAGDVLDGAERWDATAAR